VAIVGLPSVLIAASAAVIFALGALHLWYTFRGDKLHPRDAELRAKLEQVPLVPSCIVATAFYVGGLVLAAA
jgi:hypothetical protein